MLEVLAKFAVVAIFIIVAGFLGIVLYESLFPPKEQEIYSDDSKQQNTDQQSANKRAGETSVSTSTKQSVDDRIAIYTKYLAIFTALLVLVSAFQITYLISADKTAARAAKAAEDAGKIADQSLKTLQRAFVFIGDIKKIWHFDPTLKKYWYSIIPVWTNSGNTPTKNLKVWVNSRIEKEPAPDDFGFPPPTAPSIPLLVAPHGGIEADPIIKYGDVLIPVQKGEAHFYIWGTAKYMDIFDGTKEHVTRFAYKVSVLGDLSKKPTDKNVIEWRFALHSRFNCSDEECESQGYGPSVP